MKEREGLKGNLRFPYMSAKYVHILPWCPVFQFRNGLECQARHMGEEDVMGSTVWYSSMPPTGWWDALKMYFMLIISGCAYISIRNANRAIFIDC